MENTRVDLLQRLSAIGREQASQFVFITGLAGSGKTSIATSLAQHLATEDVILACFFCKRDDPAFRDATRIFPTLAHKIATSYKPYAGKLVEMLKGDSSVALGSIGQQVQQLLISPLGGLLLENLVLQLPLSLMLWMSVMGRRMGSSRPYLMVSWSSVQAFMG